MRILVISPLFVPQADSEAFCGAKFVLALRETGADVVVISDPDHGEHRSTDSSAAWASLESATLAIRTKRNRNLLESASCALRYQTWAWARWNGAVVRAAKKLHCEIPFDLIVTRSLTWDACVAGYWIAKALHRPWIANQNDPWNLRKIGLRSVRPQNQAYQLLMDFWLRRCLRSATKITYPCARLAGYFARTGRVPHKASIIPHIGWERRSEPPPRQFTIVHAGKVGSDDCTGRSSLPLLRGLARFLRETPNAQANCQLIFVGPEDPMASKAGQELNLTDHVKSVGRVSYEESLRYVAKSAVCVLVEGELQEGIFLPSKLVDYIAARKPVLALSPRIGTVADLAAGQGILRADPDDIEGTAAHLEFLYERFQKGELSRCQPPESLIREFEPKTVVRLFLDLVEEVIDRRQSVRDFGV